jgi:hypothetical protein
MTNNLGFIAWRKRPPLGPKRSNEPLGIIRRIKTQKMIYWTRLRPEKFLPKVFSTAREEYLARALQVLAQKLIDALA